MQQPSEAQRDTSPPCRTSRLRMRRTRQRQRSGLRSIAFDIRTSEVDALIARGLLSRDAGGDPEAVAMALGRLLDIVLRPARRN
jgi:hypothetical protein